MRGGRWSEEDEGRETEGGRWGEGDGGRTAVDKEASHFYNFVLFCHVLNEPGNIASSSVVVLVTVSPFKAPTTSHA